MRAVCVDDEINIMEGIVRMCESLPQISEAKGFTRAVDVLEWLSHETVELALLDIDMPGMNGIRLAERIKAGCPDTAVIFLTGYPQYAVDAFEVRASGYLLKPITREMLEKDVVYALAVRGVGMVPEGHVVVRTFGNFDVYVDGNPVRFHRARSKEIFAYLVDKQGIRLIRKEIFTALWENKEYDKKGQKELDVYIRSMRDTFREYGIEDIFEMSRSGLRIIPERFACDAYNFFLGDVSAINSYRGKYMSAYSWASITESLIYWKALEKTTE